MINVLFVCLGNICRSPTAEGVFSALVEKEGLSQSIRIDSAGTGAWHTGSPPDDRAQAAAKARGYDLSLQRARKIIDTDFHIFHYIVAMDRKNYTDLLHIAPPETRSKIQLFLTFAPNLSVAEVPDPYYGSPDGFARVLDLIESASHGLLRDIRRQHLDNNKEN